jgi:hypothetical protein
MLAFFLFLSFQLAALRETFRSRDAESEKGQEQQSRPETKPVVLQK